MSSVLPGLANCLLLQMHLLVKIETICATQDNLLRDDSKKILFQGMFNLLVPFHDSRIFNAHRRWDDAFLLETKKTLKASGTELPERKLQAQVPLQVFTLSDRAQDDWVWRSFTLRRLESLGILRCPRRPLIESQIIRRPRTSENS